MKNFFAKLFAPKPEIIQERVLCYLQQLPKGVHVDFKKEQNVLIGKIKIEDQEDPIYVQARNPSELTKMINEAIYISFDMKNEYIDFFHERGDYYTPTQEAQAELKRLWGKNVASYDFRPLSVLEKDKKELATI
jgi:hypothetical protein